VPFVPERRFGDAARLFESVESWYASYAENMGELFAQMARAFRSDRVNVLMSHLYTDGALLGGGERQVNFGVEYAVPPSRLPGTATYLALGHVHRPQSVKGSPSPARYSGSLLQLDFGEVDQTKSVSIVDASPGKPAQVREVALQGGRKLLDVRGTLEQLQQRAGEFGDAYLRVVVNTGGPVPNIVDQVRDVLPNAVDVGVDYPRDPHEAPARDLANLEPLDQYVAYYRAVHETEPRSALTDAFKEVLELEHEAH
jgi:exonuclease SbcD